jgi:hypothetical protein
MGTWHRGCFRSYSWRNPICGHHVSHHNFRYDGGWLRIHDQETGLTTGVTGQQGMLTPPRHMISLPVCPEARVCPFISLTCNICLCLETDLCLVSLWTYIIDIYIHRVFYHILLLKSTLLSYRTMNVC